jgi:hypothetical protein
VTKPAHARRPQQHRAPIHLGTTAPISLLTTVHPARARPAATPPRSCSVPPCRTGRRLRCSPGLRLIVATQLSSDLTTTPPPPHHRRHLPPTTPPTTLPCAPRKPEQFITVTVAAPDTAFGRQEVEQTTKGLLSITIATTRSHPRLYIDAPTSPIPPGDRYPGSIFQEPRPPRRLLSRVCDKSDQLAHRHHCATSNHSAAQSSTWHEKR